MTPVVELLRREPPARRFVAAHAQSALGQGLGYVAVVTLGYQRSHSAWMVAAILLAELAPAALFSSAIGVLSDRVPRRAVLVGADVARCLAFALLALVHAPVAIIALALLTGIGNAAFSPAALAALPELVSEQRLATATGLFAVVDELGYLVGPAIAALALTAVDVRGLMGVDAFMFALSALALTRVPLGRARAAGAAPARLGSSQSRLGGLREDWRAGVRVLLRDRQLAPLLLCSAAFVLIAGGVNVWELLLVRGPLHGGATGYALVVTSMSAGIGLGALIASRRRVPDLRGGYALGLACCAVGLVVASAAGSLPLALVSFALFGVGNGAALTCERLVIQRRVPEELRGRAFGVRASLVAWALNGSLVIAALAGADAGPRILLACAGTSTALVAATAAVVLGPAPRGGAGGEPAPAPRRTPHGTRAGPPAAAARERAGQERSRRGP